MTTRDLEIQRQAINKEMQWLLRWNQGEQNTKENSPQLQRGTSFSGTTHSVCTPRHDIDEQEILKQFGTAGYMSVRTCFRTMQGQPK